MNDSFTEDMLMGFKSDPSGTDLFFDITLLTFFNTLRFMRPMFCMGAKHVSNPEHTELVAHKFKHRFIHDSCHRLRCPTHVRG